MICLVAPVAEKGEVFLAAVAAHGANNAVVGIITSVGINTSVGIITIVAVVGINTIVGIVITNNLMDRHIFRCVGIGG